MPISCSPFGPEKWRGSSDCSPASHTMLMVVPLYFCASLTARSAALSANVSDEYRAATATVLAIKINLCNVRISVPPCYTADLAGRNTEARFLSPTVNLRVFARRCAFTAGLQGPRVPANHDRDRG